MRNSSASLLLQSFQDEKETLEKELKLSQEIFEKYPEFTEKLKQQEESLPSDFIQKMLIRQEASIFKVLLAADTQYLSEYSGEIPTKILQEMRAIVKNPVKIYLILYHLMSVLEGDFFKENHALSTQILEATHHAEFDPFGIIRFNTFLKLGKKIYALYELKNILKHITEKDAKEKFAKMLSLYHSPESVYKLARDIIEECRMHPKLHEYEQVKINPNLSLEELMQKMNTLLEKVFLECKLNFFNAQSSLKFLGKPLQDFMQKVMKTIQDHQIDFHKHLDSLVAPENSNISPEDIHLVRMMNYPLKQGIITLYQADIFFRLLCQETKVTQRKMNSYLFTTPIVAPLQKMSLVSF